MHISEIKNKYNHLNFQKYDVNLRSKVYFICDKQGEIIYVGSTKSIATRMQAQSQKLEFDGMPVYFFEGSRAECLRKEKLLIKECRPKYNYQHRGGYTFSRESNKIPVKTQAIKRIMEKQRVSQTALAKKMGVSRQRVFQLVNDWYLSQKSLNIICKTLGIEDASVIRK